MATGRVIEVGSKSQPGEFHRVELDPLGFIVSCTCKGWEYRKACTHAKKVSAELSKRPVATCGACACPLAEPVGSCMCTVCAEMHGAPVMLASGEWIRRKARPVSDRLANTPTVAGVVSDLYQRGDDVLLKLNLPR